MTIRDQIWLLAHSKEPEDRREFGVLYWKARGLKHREVAKKLGYSEYWVQRYVTRAYVTFDVPKSWSKEAKLEFLEKHVYPELKELVAGEPEVLKELPPPPVDEAVIRAPADETIIGEPMDEKEEEESQEREERPEPEKEPIPLRTPRRLSGPTLPSLGLVGAVLIGLCVVGIVGVAIVYQMGRNSSPSIPRSLAVASQVAVLKSQLPTQRPPTLAPTLAPTNRPLPTETPAPTAAPLPTNIPFVPPADGILFQDNFDNGWKSDWNLGNNWITTDGALTQTTQAAFQNYYSWATLDKPEWKNYALSVKISIPYMGSAAQSNVAVAVRINTQAKYLGVQILPFVGNALFFLGHSYSDSDAVASSRVFEFETGSTLQIEANGNNFAASVDGRQVQQVSISGYDSGGIALGIDCLSSLGCPSFDNVKVTYLP